MEQGLEHGIESSSTTDLKLIYMYKYKLELKDC